MEQRFSIHSDATDLWKRREEPALPAYEPDLAESPIAPTQSPQRAGSFHDLFGGLFDEGPAAPILAGSTIDGGGRLPPATPGQPSGDRKPERGPQNGGEGGGPEPPDNGGKEGGGGRDRLPGHDGKDVFESPSGPKTKPKPKPSSGSDGDEDAKGPACGLSLGTVALLALLLADPITAPAAAAAAAALLLTSGASGPQSGLGPADLPPPT